MSPERRRPPGQSPAIARLPWSHIRLTPVEREDAAQFHAWQNDAALRDLTMAYRFPVQRHRVEDWITSLGSQGTPTRIFYAVRFDDALIGYALLNNIEPFHRSAQLGVSIADTRLRTRAAGHVAGALIVDFGFRALDLRRIEAHLLTSNISTKHAIEHAGFVHEGTLRQSYYSAGRTHDVYVYGVLRDEYLMWPPADAHRLTTSFDGE